MQDGLALAFAGELAYCFASHKLTRRLIYMGEAHNLIDFLAVTRPWNGVPTLQSAQSPWGGGVRELPQTASRK
jgi:hypothetical protein